MITLRISDVYGIFPTRESCLRFIEDLRWNKKPVCPHCGSFRISSVPRESRYHCNSCNVSFSVTVNTLFHNTRVPLQKWFLAIDIFSHYGSGVSVRKLAEMIGVNKNTAWKMSVKLKTAFNDYGDFLVRIAEEGEALFRKKVNV